ncbi:MAG: type II secretion system F family protein [Candidatus Eremiobacteraeota bacterium]|nr:type II secretion system F family protein [Candidatus Eremiobacteraeota bacterium]
MARFTYEAQDAENHTVTGTLQAADRNAALQTLSEKYPLVTELTELIPKRSLLAMMRRGPSTEQILGVYQQLAVATGAGVPLKQSLDTMAEDSDSPRLQAVLFQMSASLSSGLTLSQAMSEHPDVFAPYQPKLIQAGEVSGKMAEILAQLALDMEGREALTSQVRSAIAYPIFVLVVAGLLSAAMLGWGVPQIKGVFDAMGAELPLPTRFLVLVGLSLSQMWWMWILGLALAVWLYQRLSKHPRARRFVERVVLVSWPFGEVYRLLNVSLFARTLGLLYRSGLPLSTALEVLGEATSSLRMVEVIQVLRRRVTHGELLSSAMRGSGFCPSMAVEMVSTGESSGSLDKMLHELDRFYTRRCEHAIKALTSLIEPALTVVVGILLGGVILGLALPFLNLPALMM